MTFGARREVRDAERVAGAGRVGGDRACRDVRLAVAYLGSRASGQSPSSAARRATALVAALLEAGAQ